MINVCEYSNFIPKPKPFQNNFSEVYMQRIILIKIKNEKFYFLMKLHFNYLGTPLSTGIRVLNQFGLSLKIDKKY